MMVNKRSHYDIFRGSLYGKYFLITDVQVLKDRHLFDQLTLLINELINKDFERLISLLYRIDINEKDLKSLLKENNSTDSAVIIASLIIERQLQKIKSRQQLKNDENISENERW